MHVYQQEAHMGAAGHADKIVIHRNRSMSDDELPPREDRAAWVARFGEYRHIPVRRYGSFRLDTEWFRHPSEGEAQMLEHVLVVEITAQYEMDLVGWYPRSSLPPAEWSMPSHAQVVRIARWWLDGHRPSPRGDRLYLPCYRRRIGPPDNGHAMTAGDWYLDAFVRRPRHPMIETAKFAPLVEAAIRELELTEAPSEATESSSEL